MNLILTSIEHSFDCHLEHNSDPGTNMIGSILNSEKVGLRWWQIDMHYKINSDEPWILCTCKAVTPIANLQNNIQYTQWQMEPDLTAAPTSIVEYLAAVVAIMIIKWASGQRKAVAAVSMMKTPVTGAARLNRMKMSGHCSSLHVILVAMRTDKTTRYVIVTTKMMNHNPHIDDFTHQITLLIGYGPRIWFDTFWLSFVSGFDNFPQQTPSPFSNQWYLGHSRNDHLGF